MRTIHLDIQIVFLKIKFSILYDLLVKPSSMSEYPNSQNWTWELFFWVGNLSYWVEIEGDLKWGQWSPEAMYRVLCGCAWMLLSSSEEKVQCVYHFLWEAWDPKIIENQDDFPSLATSATIGMWICISAPWFFRKFRAHLKNRNECLPWSEVLT